MALMSRVKSDFESPCLSPLGKVPQNPATRLRMRSWSALAVVAGLLVFQQVLLQPALVRLNSDGPVINIAGRQRMLSQKLAKTALALQISESPAAREVRQAELATVVAEWTRAHRGLQQGDRQLDLPGGNEPAIRRAFAEIEPDFQAMLSAVQVLLPIAGLDHQLTAVQQAAIQTIMIHEDHFLHGMQALVELYAANARTHIWQLQLLSWGIVATILALLFAMQWFVVRPAVDSFGLRFASSEAEYRRLVESMSEGLIVHDGQGRIQFANRRFCEIVGRSVDQLRGQPAAQFVAETDRGRYEQLFAEARGPVKPMELGLLSAGGLRTETMASTQPLFDDYGVQQGFLLVVTDITARKLAEQQSRELLEQLTHADRLKSMGQLAAGLAHEINQPLAAIANYAESCLTLLQTSTLTPESLKIPVERILSAALRGGEIIRRSRRFAQRRPYALQAESLNDLICDIEQLCRPEAQHRDITVELILASDLPAIAVDGIQVQQVLTNLIQNAFVAIDANGGQSRRLQVTTELLPHEFVRVSVSDSGCGLSMSDASRVFEPFFTTSSDGLGLGLPIARNIVEAHGGAIEAFSNPDCGATFRFTLPLQPAPAGTAHSSIQEESVHA